MTTSPRGHARFMMAARLWCIPCFKINAVHTTSEKNWSPIRLHNVCNCHEFTTLIQTPLDSFYIRKLVVKLANKRLISVSVARSSLWFYQLFIILERALTSNIHLFGKHINSCSVSLFCIELDPISGELKSETIFGVKSKE